MANSRVEFTAGVKSILAHRAGYRCSKPCCRALTVGPGVTPIDSKINLGVAAHITAASPGGPRYDGSLTEEERGSVPNGIYLCQTHAKEIDDDPAGYDVFTLRAWKRDAENDASASLGKPISGQSLSASVEVMLSRADDESLTIVGKINLPDLTKVLITLLAPESNRMLGQAHSVINEGAFATAGFSNGGQPHIAGWYEVEVLAHFNNAWRQPRSVVSVVGQQGRYLVGQYAEPVHPEFDDSEKAFRARFSCIAPRLRNAPKRTLAEVGASIQIVKSAILTVDGRKSSATVDEVIKYFLALPGIKEREGWSCRTLANDAIVVEYSYWDDDKPAIAEWIAILEAGAVRYRNLDGKYLSWLPDD